MYRKHRKKNTKQYASTLSPHANKLLQQRQQYLYGDQVKGRKKHNPASRTVESEIKPSTTSARQALARSYISITLLGKVVMALHITDEITRDVPIDINPKTIQLMAYLAWQRGKKIKRDQLIQMIWGRGRTNEDDIVEEDEGKMGEAFEAAKKSLRRVIRKAIKKWNDERGEILLDPDDPKLDIFEHRYQLWWLSPLCRVIDLDAVEEQHRIIMEAKMRGALVNTVPEHIKDACDALIVAYNGDFLESLIRLNPLDLKTWASAWVREPITYYRDCYLQAVWYAAEYERQVGQHFADERLADDVESRRKQRECWARAVELYRLYTMYACNNRLDEKVFFQMPGRGNGDRVTWSERALCECIQLCGKLGDPYLLDEVYNAYYDLMKIVSDENWEPSEETHRKVLAASSLAATYRLER